MTVAEYEILMKAARLRMTDKTYFAHLTAWLTFAAKATKKTGKNKLRPIYDKFDKFFNYESAVEQVTGKAGKQDRFGALKDYLRGKE